MLFRSQSGFAANQANQGLPAPSLSTLSGPIAVAARALTGNAVDRAAVDTHGFRFGQVLSYRDPMFLPGGSKYLDLAGFIKLNGSNALWMKGEGKEPAGSAIEFLNQ